MTYSEQYAKVIESGEPLGLTRLYVEMTEDFYMRTAKIFQTKEMSENDKRLYKLFYKTIKRFISILKIGLKGNSRKPITQDVLQFESSLRQMDLFFEDVDIILDALVDDNEKPKSKKDKAKGLAEKIKGYLPDTFWGIDISWLKKLLNQLLKLLPIPLG